MTAICFILSHLFYQFPIYSYQQDFQSPYTINNIKNFLYSATQTSSDCIMTRKDIYQTFWHWLSFKIIGKHRILLQLSVIKQIRIFLYHKQSPAWYTSEFKRRKKLEKAHQGRQHLWRKKVHMFQFALKLFI